ncbi:hypothetical protein FSP39_014319 [Pinctada imbricata]|uniref:IgGFc-binding protein N-terminal domain-containing protein n=1 Tax=Pinctada imbricata TaxID=66713 RepID=A0AA89CAV7_PINIB|nr:hypothetical protein FSP39_014319 [Pinctada imbricata]
MVVSLDDGSITLSSDISGVDRSVDISSKSGLSLSLPTSLLRGGSFVARNSVTIRSNTDIAVFVVILGSSGTGDGYMAIPATSLSKKYFFSMNQNALLSIVSFSDETNINIVSNAGTNINLRSSGLSSSNTNITLARGQVLQIRHSSWVMGYVTSSKPFMFLHGSHGDSAYSRYRASFIDSVFYTDARFFIIPLLYNGTDTVTFCNRKRSLSVTSNLRVSTSSNYVYIGSLKKVSYIRADFQTSCHYIGHGFSVSVSPVTSYSTYCRFLTPYGSNFTHHAAVTVKTAVDDGIKLQNIPNKNDITENHRETITVDGVSYSAIYYTVEAGQYEVYHTSPNVTFGVISYGFGKGANTAYGFPVCFKKSSSP